MKYLIDSIICIIILGTCLYGYSKGVKVYECFVEGAKEGITICLKIFPYLLAMLLAVSALRISGGMDIIIKAVTPLVKYIGLPGEVVPLTIIKPLSGSGALGVFAEILNKYGPDGKIGRISSIIMGSTETIFYTLTVYFGAVGIKKIRHTLWAAIMADLVSIIMAVFLVKTMF